MTLNMIQDCHNLTSAVYKQNLSSSVTPLNESASLVGGSMIRVPPNFPSQQVEHKNNNSESKQFQLLQFSNPFPSSNFHLGRKFPFASRILMKVLCSI